MGKIELVNEAIKKAEGLVEEATKILTDSWLEHVLFSWRWWISLFLTVIPWILWIKYRPRKSTYRLLFVGFFIIIVTSYLDFLGICYGLWYYSWKPVPTLPAYLPWDFTLFPVSVMFFLQIKPNTKPIVKAIIFSGANAYIFEPFFQWLDFYHPENWKYTYSFIIYIFIYLFADFLFKRKDFDSIS